MIIIKTNVPLPHAPMHSLPQPILVILFRPFSFPVPKDFKIIWLSNLLILRMLDEGYSETRRAQIEYRSKINQSQLNKILIQISNLVRTTRFWNKTHQVGSLSKDWKTKQLKSKTSKGFKLVSKNLLRSDMFEVEKPYFEY